MPYYSKSQLSPEEKQKNESAIKESVQKYMQILEEKDNEKRRLIQTVFENSLIKICEEQQLLFKTAEKNQVFINNLGNYSVYIQDIQIAKQIEQQLNNNQVDLSFFKDTLDILRQRDASERQKASITSVIDVLNTKGYLPTAEAFFFSRYAGCTARLSQR